MLITNYEKRDNILVVELSGDLMVEDVAKLKSDFHEFQSIYKYFLFDFKDVTMIDSSGLGYIVYCLKKLREKNGDVKIINLKDQAKLVFEITRVNSILDIYEDENDAIESFKMMENDNESNNSDQNEIIA